MTIAVYLLHNAGHNKHQACSSRTYPCKTKSPHETEKRLSKLLEQSHRPKVGFPTNQWNLGKHVRFCHGITVLQHLIDPRQMAIAERAVYSQDWTKCGGLTLWNAIAIGETSKTSWQTDKHRTKDDLGGTIQKANNTF